jgi:hypothetical protein
MATKLDIPKGSIEWIVNKLHVGTSDEAVKTNIRKRCTPDGGWSEAAIVKAEEYAIKCHRKNQDLYRRVMSGRL